MDQNNSNSLLIRKVNGNISVETEDLLAKEEPLEISLAWISEEKELRKNISITMRTPGNDEELATGFLFTEGIIRSNDVIENRSIAEENKITVFLKTGSTPKLPETDRNFYTTSSCGVCGKSSLEAIKTVSVFAEVKSDITADASLLYTLPQKLREQQKVFEQTGGLHASALFDGEGSLILLREDVGRHNALDKLIGAAMQKNLLPLKDHILLLSGRASFELIQKAAMAGIKVVAAIGAPSTLAVELAKETGITLTGFLKKDTFNIYSCPERIIIKEKK